MEAVDSSAARNDGTLEEDRRNSELVTICMNTAVIYEYVCIIMSDYNIAVVRICKINMNGPIFLYIIENSSNRSDFLEKGQHANLKNKR